MLWRHRAQPVAQRIFTFIQSTVTEFENRGVLSHRFNRHIGIDFPKRFCDGLAERLIKQRRVRAWRLWILPGRRFAKNAAKIRYEFLVFPENLETVHPPIYFA